MAGYLMEAMHRAAAGRWRGMMVVDRFPEFTDF